MEFIHLDPRFRKLKKFQEKEVSKALKNAKKYITKFINEQKIDSINTSSNTWSKKGKIEYYWF
jgi:fructose-specific phosphotransferase system component IIB